MKIFRETAGRWIAGVILALIAVSFVFFGVDFSLTGQTFAARVNGEEIPRQQYQQELQATQNQYQQLYQTELTEDLAQQLRRSVIERMIQGEALRQRVADLGYRVSDERLSERIQSIDAFNVGGEFSMDVYRALLRNQGMSVTGFEAEQREQLALQDLQTGIAASSFVTPAEMRAFIELVNERRELYYALFAGEDFASEVEVTDEDVESHYDENSALYTSEETVDFEYVELSLDEVADEIELTEADLREYYEDNRAQFETQEERRASHILIEHAEGEREAAEAEIEEVMSRLEQGEPFADLAAEYSDDAGTANQGGDLGWVGRGTLSGPFEDALYSIEEVGGVAGPVETDFGLHVIRLEELREGEVDSYEDVRDELREELSTGRAEDVFFERANRLADLAFDAFDELASVAMELDVPLETVEDFPRSGESSAFENTAPIVDAAFDEENINSGTNSDLIELGDDHVLVLRVTEHNEPAPLPLEEVEGEIRDELTRERASELAQQALDAYLEAVEGGADREEAAAEHGGRWNAPGWVRRNNSELPGEVVSVAFSLPEPSSGTARERAMLSGGDEAVVFVDAVEPGDPEELPPEERERLREQLIEQRAQAEFNAYTTTVRENASVTISDWVLEPQF